MHRVTVEVFLERKPGTERLAGAGPDRGTARELGQCLGRVHADRVLEPGRRERFETPGKLHRHRQVPQRMELHHDFHGAAHGRPDLLERAQRGIQLGRRDMDAVIGDGRRVERPDFHGGDALGQQTFGQRPGVGHEGVQILVRPGDGVFVPVRHGLDLRRADIPGAGAGVVDALPVAAQAAQQLMHRLLRHVAEQVPQRDIDRRRGPGLGAGAGLRHRQVQHFAMEVLDPQRVLAQQACGQRVMDVRLDRAGPVERFA